MSVLNFKELAQQLAEKAKKAEVVFKAKMGGVTTEIHKDGSRFTVLIDGEELDSYKSQKEAEAMAKQFVKQYKR